MLEKVFITSFIVFAIYATMMEGMIFEFVQKWYYKATENWSEKKAEFYAKPIFDCPICMTIYYGSAAYWLIYGNSWQEWLIVIIAAMGVNTIFVKVFPDK